MFFLLFIRLFWRNICNFRTWHGTFHSLLTHIRTNTCMCFFVCMLPTATATATTTTTTFSFTSSDNSGNVTSQHNTLCRLLAPLCRSAAHEHHNNNNDDNNNRIFNQLVFCKRDVSWQSARALGSEANDTNWNETSFWCCCAYVTRQRRMQSSNSDRASELANVQNAVGSWLGRFYFFFAFYIFCCLLYFLFLPFRFLQACNARRDSETLRVCIPDTTTHTHAYSRIHMRKHICSFVLTVCFGFFVTQPARPPRDLPSGGHAN